MDRKLKSLYDLAECERIHIDRRTLRRRAAISVALPDGERCVAIDYARTRTPRSEKAIVAHELGHQMTGALYRADSSYEERCRCEARADRWAIERLLPYDDIRGAMIRGHIEPWAIAEELYEDEELVRKALWYYTEVRGLDFNAEP